MQNKRLKLSFTFIATIITLLVAISAHAAYRIEYEHDSLDRLVKVVHPAGETVVYTYDAVGNRIRKVSAINAAPTVLDFVIENGQTQRSTIKAISAQFSEDVTVNSQALSISGLSNGLIDLTDMVFDYNSTSFTATWTLTSSLPDDQYTACIDASQITDSGGKNLDGNDDGADGDDAIFTFYRLFGDSTGDGQVNHEDLFDLANIWLVTPNQTGLDNNDDNIVNFIDFGDFAKNWTSSFTQPTTYPMVIKHIIASDQIQRSMVKDIGFQFDRNVNVSNDALVITGQNTGLVDITSASFNYNAITFTSTWLFAESLPDDIFSIAVDAAKVFDTHGYKLDGNQDGVMGDSYNINACRPFGDTTGNSRVDIEDLSILISYWLNEPGETGLDVDESNIINFKDFASFAENWLESY